MHSQILAETQRLGLEPSLLHLNQNKALFAVDITNGGSKVDAKHRQRVALNVAVLVRTHLNGHDILLKQRRQDGASNAVILHQVLEHHIIQWIGYRHNAQILMFSVQIYVKNSKLPKLVSTNLPSKHTGPISTLKNCFEFNHILNRIMVSPEQDGTVAGGDNLA